MKEQKVRFYKSRENMTRSLQTFYSQDVLGKREYIALRKANKSLEAINFSPYAELAKFREGIDIGDLINFESSLKVGLDEDEECIGMYIHMAQNLWNFI